MVESVVSRIAALREMSVCELRNKYREMFDGCEPLSSNRNFLWRRIAYRIQEIEFGGLSDPDRARLEALKTELDPINRIIKRSAKQRKASGKNNGRDSRLPLPGTVIRRKYKGGVVEVKVLVDGFEHDGRPFKTLTAVAKEVTGCHWNGYLFFDL
jgi:hypothetical protein